MNTRYFKMLLRAAMGGIAVLWITSAFAADSGQYKLVNGVAVYLGIIPSEMVLGHPKTHAEAEMHGGAPPRYQQHIVVALFDKASGKRISDAKVSAWVQEAGSLPETRKKLEPMLISDTISYGNYFNILPTGNPYRILVRIELHDAPGVIEAQFEHRPARD